MAATKQAVAAARDRGMMDAVEGRPFAPPVQVAEGKAYAQRYAEYFGEQVDAAYAYLDDPVAWLHQQPYGAGRAAALAGDRRLNPYRTDTQQAREWYAGYDAGKRTLQRVVAAAAGYKQLSLFEGGGVDDDR